MRPCPWCGALGTVTLDPVMVANTSLANWSLAGTQSKIVARSAYRLGCSACERGVTGRVEGLEVSVEGIILAGTFVADG